ncbi:hypothetical protein GV827_19645 [Sulfitobacter sp. JBTF-M27]|uniref:Uncharacterized protein n=1 Tax=Sulfitobacter sediminilitoris TaxID=2698830 RepID=A0A6P0CGU6_9RHOB|nr:hypothetical protein [Sulfitobacter sediminilitoris]NEK24600.1 hypothetical protein [Sulfitobacter sediminilitoris]
MSDISARDERVLIDDVKIETTEMEVVDGGGHSGGADCDAQYDVQYIAGVPTVPMVEEDLIIPAEPEEELVDMDV